MEPTVTDETAPAGAFQPGVKGDNVSAESTRPSKHTLAFNKTA
jgi:hypothetical protein